MLPSRFFDDIFNIESSSNHMNCDIYEEDNVYFIELDLPGFNKNDINIEISNGNITISAEKTESENYDTRRYFRKERKIYGKYERSFYLGEIVDENVKASFDNGILTISIPKQIEKNKKKNIEIQ